MEGGRSIGEAERHYPVFVLALSSTEGGFEFVAFPYAHEVVGVAQIELCEDAGAAHRIKHLTN
jgi:hypothetical protein